MIRNTETEKYIDMIDLSSNHFSEIQSLINLGYKSVENQESKAIITLLNAVLRLAYEGEQRCVLTIKDKFIGHCNEMK